MTLSNISPEPEPSNPSQRPQSQWQWLWPLLRKGQRWSAYAFGSFAGLHLLSTVVLPPLSRDLADDTFMMARQLYQSPQGEVLMVWGPIAVHLLTGWAIHARRLWLSQRNHGRIDWKSAANPTVISGTLLTFILAAHVLSTRIAPLVKLGSSSEVSLDMITWDLQHHRVSTTAGLLFVVGIFGYHAISGVSTFQRIRLRSLTRWGIWAAGIMATCLSLRTLYNSPAPAAWLAEQFALVHSMLRP